MATVQRLKSKPLAVATKVEDARKGIVVAFPTVSGNLDSDGDIVVAGASAYGLTVVKPKGVWSHDWATPVSKTIEAVELYPGDRQLPQKLLAAGLGGLKVTTQFNMHPDAIDARQSFASVDFFADEQEWSVGYEIVEQFYGPAGAEEALAAVNGEAARSMITGLKAEDAQQARYITKWIVYEYSPVLFGANSEAQTESVKSMSDDDRMTRIENAIERITVKSGGGVAGGDKSGRILAARNEQRLRAAGEAIAAALAELESASDDEDGKALTVVGAKLYAPLAGSHEQEREAVNSAARDKWGGGGYGMSAGPWVYVEAMFDDSAIVSVEPRDGGVSAYYQVPYVINADDTATLGAEVEVEFQVVVAPAKGKPVTPEEFKALASAKGVTLQYEGDESLTDLITDMGERLRVRPKPADANADGLDPKNHEFAPTDDEPQRCSVCGAGEGRAWHNKTEPNQGGDGESDDAKRARRAEFEKLMMEAEAVGRK